MIPRKPPKHVPRRLEGAGHPDSQSPDGEDLTRLTEPASPEPVDPQALLEQIRRRREALGPIDLSDETIRELRDEGRR